MKPFLFITFLTIGFLANAQLPEISVGIHGYVTIPNLGHLPYRTDLRAGGSLKGVVEVKKKHEGTLTVNYLQVETANHVFLYMTQIHTGYRLKAMKNFYTEPQVGFTFFTNHNKYMPASNGISAALCFGYTLKGLDLGIDYNRFFSQAEPVSFFAVRLGYNYRF